MSLNAASRWWVLGRFVLLHVGTSLTVVPVTSALNRIMIAEMQLSGTLVAFLVTLPYWLAPLQIWLGSVMDRQVQAGGQRTGWIVLGGVLAAGGCALTAPAAFLIPDNRVWGLVATGGTFILWGVGINVASVSYLALLSDQGDREQRNRTIGIMFTCMIGASIATGLFLAQRLQVYSPAQVMTSFGLISLVALVAILVGAWRIEIPVAGPLAEPPARAGLNSFHVLTENPAALRFFIYLLIILISIHAQDILLEPYGAEVMNMSVSDTSRLVSYWGAGFLISMLVSILLVRSWGERRVAAMGTWMATAAFVLICLSGFMQHIPAFAGSVVLLGIGSGFMTQSNLVLMLRMTVPQARAIYIGTWSAANFLGQALIVLPVSLGDALGEWAQNVWLGYATVFLLEAVGLWVALILLRSLRVEDFRARALQTSPLRQMGEIRYPNESLSPDYHF